MGCIVLVLGVGRCAFRPLRVVFLFLGLVSLMNISHFSGKKHLACSQATVTVAPSDLFTYRKVRLYGVAISSTVLLVSFARERAESWSRSRQLGSRDGTPPKKREKAFSAVALTYTGPRPLARNFTVPCRLLPASPTLRGRQR